MFNKLDLVVQGRLTVNVYRDNRRKDGFLDFFTGFPLQDPREVTDFDFFPTGEIRPKDLGVESFEDNNGHGVGYGVSATVNCPDLTCVPSVYPFSLTSVVFYVLPMFSLVPKNVRIYQDSPNHVTISVVKWCDHIQNKVNPKNIDTVYYFLTPITRMSWIPFTKLPKPQPPTNSPSEMPRYQGPGGILLVSSLVGSVCGTVTGSVIGGPIGCIVGGTVGGVVGGAIGGGIESGTLEGVGCGILIGGGIGLITGVGGAAIMTIAVTTAPALLPAVSVGTTTCGTVGGGATVAYTGIHSALGYIAMAASCA